MKSTFLISFLILSSVLFAQSGFESEADMIKKADEFFESGDYQNAMPLFSQLVSLYPKDGSYNMKYGYSLLHADRDKAAGLKYLKYAAGKDDVDPIASYYYALGLHSNYEFSKAISQYNKFKSAGNKKDVAKYQIDRQIEMCNNGKDLLSNIFDLNVIDKQEISANEFFRIYDLGEIGGKIIVKPDEFKSKQDLKNNDLSLIHLPSEARVLYYSGLGDNGSNGKDIFRVRKTTEGGWGSPENIGAPVNTPFDEDFPFMHPDGTLYFASKGHNSMGGYDLFKSVYNESTNTWTKPENLNFAISSAFDDVLFISDIQNQMAYFASSRATVDGKYNVYRVQISRRPMDMAFISGSFISEGEKEKKSAKISVFDVNGGKKVGTYYTDNNSGEYNIYLPKSGTTYKFVVETDDDSPVHTGKVEVPKQTELVSLKQEIRLVGNGESEKLVIKNLFDESSKGKVDEASMLTLLRSSSDLEVNTTEAEVLSQIETAPQEEKPTATDATQVSLQTQYQDLSASIETLVVELKQELSLLQNEIAFAFRYSFDNAVIADEKYDQVEVERQKMLNEADSEKKKKYLESLVKQRNTLEPIASDAIVSFDFARSLANEYDEKFNDVDRMKAEMAELKSSPNPTPEEMQQTINQTGPLVDDLKSMKSIYEIAPQRYSDLMKNTSEKLESDEKYYNELKRDLEALYLEIDRLNNEISETKNKKASQQLTEQKSAKEIDLQDLEYQFSNVRKKYQTLKNEKRNVEADAKQLNTFISKIKSSSTKSTPLAVEDQERLKELIDYFKEQRMIEDVIGDELEPFIAGNEKGKDLSSAHYYAAVDNSGNEIDYDELYFLNLAAIEIISDQVEKREEASKLYTNWARTVNEDKVIKKNELEFIENKSEKALVEEQIRILEEKELSYQSKASQYQEEALTYAAAETDGEGPIAENQQKGSDNEQIAESNAADLTKDKASSGENKGSKKSTGGSVTSGNIQASSNMTTMLAAGIPAAVIAGTTLSDLNKGYTESVKELEEESDDPVAHINLAVFELSWARSVDEMIAEKEQTLSSTSDEEKRKSLEAELNNLQTEKTKHLEVAASEFSAFEMDDFLNESSIDIDNDLKVNYNTQVNPEFDYNSNYAEIQKNIENDPFLSTLQKSTKLTQLHSFWAQSIQDEIIYQNQLLKEAKSPEDKKAIEDLITKLQEQKLAQIKKSNKHYEIVKKATPAELAAANVEGDNRIDTETGETSPVIAGSESSTSTSGAQSDDGASTPPTYEDYQTQFNNEQKELTSKIEQKELSMSEVASKSEKQQIGLELALLKVEQSDREKALSEVEGKSGESIMSPEAERALAEENISWQDEAVGYVFSKKDFSASVPEHASALQFYNEAKKHYDEVVFLEKQKQALLLSDVVDKEAQQNILEIQTKIEQEMTLVYRALSKANRTAYTENKRMIQKMMEGHPNLKAENPKLYRQVQSADVIYNEVGSYESQAESFTSNSLKFDIYDQSQYMAEYVLTEQQGILEELEGLPYTGELAFLSPTVVSGTGVSEQALAEFKISQEAANAILEKPAFVEYEKDLNAKDELKKERLELDAMVLDERAKLNTLQEERIFTVETAAATKGGKRKKLMKEAEVINSKIALQEAKIDSITLVQVQNKEKQNVVAQNSERVLKQESQTDRKNIVLLAEIRYKGESEGKYIVAGDEIAEEVASASSNEVETPDDAEPQVAVAAIPPGSEKYKQSISETEFVEKAAVIPEVLDGDLFVTTTSLKATPYSESKPIPVDEDIPTGLIFKVQIGAYRNPIPQDLFKGFAPLMGEKIPSGITRYTAGLFRDFGNANRAKNEIRAMGYQDAFVVAFMDGKRIPFNELQNLGDIDLTVPKDAAVILPSVNVPKEVLKQPSTIRDPGQVSNAIAEQTVNTRDVKGIFFAVQVGVYSNTVLPEKLTGLRDLNSELLDNGNIRYSVGQFNSRELAQSRRDELVNQGVADAFVTAYADGFRITVSEALTRTQ